MFLDIKDGDKDGPAPHFGRNCRQRQGGAAKSAGGGAQVNILLNGSGGIMMPELFDVNHFPGR